MHRFALLCLLLALPVPAAPTLEGTVQPYRKVEVSAHVSSHVVDLKAAEGDTVKAGQPLAQLYARLEELEMKRSKALLDRREYEAKGARSLFDNRVIPEARAMESRIDLELARLNFETAAEQVRLRTILAPIDGLVVERTRELGEAVGASQVVFRILDLSKATILCTARPDKVARLVPGQKLTVHVSIPEGMTALQAEVVLVSPCPDASGLMRLKLLVRDPAPGLRAGLKALVDLPEAP
ncbi:efflux RND transporter periplasmic adaptor subunit [Geothrix sp. 21YS21S-2]|uniref:efflux RND transporter periplasmic adaptor subunit n=1 Tax=Geothrix sp. 21YS21S-2 TaxID=3068893 RepID=UPI0027BA4675|nr:efflux RND transporter periplasmic adaptor subunit [Geothrix sp. 21YS21S-2]